MSSAISVTGSDRLHNILISLEMEISDSILAALSEEVAVCRQEQKKQLLLVDPILVCMDTVIRHIDEIDEIRALPDVRALDVLNELVRAYQLITEEFVGQQEACQEVVSASLQKVFAWQHACIQDCIQNNQHKMQQATAAVPSVRIAAPASDADVQDLLTTVQQEIATTGMLAIRESATLLELVYTQQKRDRQARQGAKTFAGNFQGMNEVKQVENVKRVEPARETGKGEEDAFKSLIEENISSLQQIFQQELGRLRHDFIRE
ncbi:MAG: hypothetical protein D3911_01140 [Candidatus Electrothrix sp. AW3_4]|nr:hypothetical protein [Candidatus Electrothrix gigas]